jgi:hypothetical protein
MTDNYCFEMFSKAGELACRNGVKKIYEKIEGVKRITETEIDEFVDLVINKIEEKHPEVWDTEPRNHIRRLTNAKLLEVGYSFKL